MCKGVCVHTEKREYTAVTTVFSHLELPLLLTRSAFSAAAFPLGEPCSLPDPVNVS